MISYEVGKRYDAAIRGEGTQFDLADDGAFLAVYFSRPDEKEVAQFGAENPFEFRFVTLQGIMMCVFRIGSLNWMDAPYTPHLSQNLTKFTLPNEGETQIYVHEYHFYQKVFRRSHGFKDEAFFQS